MVHAFVDGSIAGGVVNVALYASLLLVALVLRPSCKPLFLRTYLAHQGAHFLVVLFGVSRLFWAAWILAKHDGSTVTVPAGAVGFYTDSCCTAAFFIGVMLVVTQVADALVAGWKTSQRLWRAWAALTLLLVAYQIALALLLFVPSLSPLPCPEPLSLGCALEGVQDLTISDHKPVR